MNKAHFVTALAKRTGSTRSQAAAALEGVLDTVARALAAGESVSITGFGIFGTVHRASRTARNPQTGERITRQERTDARFRPAPGLQDLVNGDRPVPATGSAAKKAAKYSKTPRDAR